MHGDINRLINAVHGMNKNDYLLVAGDFGFVYNCDESENKLLNYLQKILSQKQITLLFIDGNHENFPEIYKYPVNVWKDGKIHKIRENIFHLMRGQVFKIDGFSVFTFGGAYSTDRYLRNPGTSWWKEEIANNTEIKEAWNNLEKHNFEIDYIITHQVPGYLQKMFANGTYDYTDKTKKDNSILQFFDEISKKVKYKKWFCGHMHQDIKLSKQVQVLYFGLENLN